MRGNWGKERGTYRVASAKLLLCSDDRSASLGGVERGFASDDRLSCCSAPAGLASNFRDGVPVIHGCGRRIALRLGCGEDRFQNEELFAVREEVVCGCGWKWKAREEVEICCDRFGGEAVAHNCACRVNQTLSSIGSRSR